MSLLPWPEPNADVDTVPALVTIRATVNGIPFRGNRGDGFIVVAIGAGGFTSASGKFDDAIRPVQVGDVGIFSGRRTNYRGKPTLDVQFVKWQARPLAAR